LVGAEDGSECLMKFDPHHLAVAAELRRQASLRRFLAVMLLLFLAVVIAVTYIIEKGLL
jgi:hypothetical protein